MVKEISDRLLVQANKLYGQGQKRKALISLQKILENHSKHIKALELAHRISKELNFKNNVFDKRLLYLQKQAKEPFNILGYKRDFLMTTAKKACLEAGATWQWLNLEEKSFEFNANNYHLFFYINHFDWNLSAEETQSLYAELPHICWMVDPLVNFSPGVFDKRLIHPQNYYFAYCKGQVEVFRKKGFENINYLPPAVDFDKKPFKDLKEEEYLHDISFIGALQDNNHSTYHNLFLPDILKHLNTHINFIDSLKWHRLLDLMQTAIKLQSDNIDDFIMPQIVEALKEEGNIDLPPREWRKDYPELTYKSLIYSLAKEVVPIQRKAYIQALTSKGKQVDIYGNKLWGEIDDAYLSYHGMAELSQERPHIYQHSKINLNLTRFYALNAIPGRVFDILGSGGFVMTNYSPVIEECFEIDKEIVCFESADELIEKVQYYLENPIERKEIALRGYQRVWKDHTIRNRLKMMISKLKKDEAIHHHFDII